MRPLSLAGLFAAAAGTVLGFINVLSVIWTRELTAETYRAMAVGAAESLVRSSRLRVSHRRVAARRNRYGTAST